MRSRRHRPRGAALLMAMACLAMLSIVFGILLKVGSAERTQARTEENRLRAGWLAESGLERAWAKLSGSPDYRGETWKISPEAMRGRHGAVVAITVQPAPGEPGRFVVTARADYPAEGTARARQTRIAEFTPNPSGTDP